jgi:hypothetical protein
MCLKERINGFKSRVYYDEFLKGKLAPEELDVTVMSESSLGRNWLKPEEDEAWQNL